MESSRLHKLAKGGTPPKADAEFVCLIHAGWFKTTFPNDAGRYRLVEVANRKGTAWAKDTIREGVHNACKNYYFRREQSKPASADDRYFLDISEANELAVEIYDIHPFLDGNTRATFSLRNYLLDASGLDRLDRGLGEDAERYQRAWEQAAPGDHDFLDEVVIGILLAFEM